MKAWLSSTGSGHVLHDGSQFEIGKGRTEDSAGAARRSEMEREEELSVSLSATCVRISTRHNHFGIDARSRGCMRADRFWSMMGVLMCLYALHCISGGISCFEASYRRRCATVGVFRSRGG